MSPTLLPEEVTVSDTRQGAGPDASVAAPQSNGTRAQDASPECGKGSSLRTATSADVAALHALIVSHTEEGHLLARTVEELQRHASRFVVAERGGGVIGCAELAPLSQEVAEVRSLVVDRATRGGGLGGAMIDELRRRATKLGFGRLCAFAHDPGYFVRLGFSIVPHLWIPEKIGTDCRSCSLFRRCGQHALVLSLHDVRGRAPAGASTTSGRRI